MISSQPVSDHADESERDPQAAALPVATPVVTPAYPVKTTDVGAYPAKPTDPYAALRDEMARSIDDLTIIHRVLKDGDLDATLRGLSPQMYAELISHVASEFDRLEATIFPFFAH